MAYKFTKITDVRFDNYDSIVNANINQMNTFLNKYGFKVNWVKDYKFNTDDVGMFIGSEQDNASVFPIALNKKLLITESEDLDYDIKCTIAHEVGHGIFNFLNDVYDLDDLNEEYIVEEFGLDYAMGIYEGNDLMNILEDYMEEYQ